MSSPLARYLRDFAAEAAPPAELAQVIPTLAFDLPEPVFAEPEPEPINPEDIRREAHEGGRREATETLEAKHAEEIEALKAAHATELEAERQRIEADHAASLAAILADIPQRISEQLSEASVRLFAPLLRSQAERQAMDEMAKRLVPVLASEVGEQIRVIGPVRLCDMLRDRLDGAARDVQFEPSDDADLRVEIGDTLMVSRLAEFAADLEKVLE